MPQNKKFRRSANHFGTLGASDLGESQSALFSYARCCPLKFQMILGKDDIVIKKMKNAFESSLSEVSGPFTTQ